MANGSYQQLGDTMSSLEATLSRMLSVKKESRPKVELRELATEASVLFLNLRQINRIILQDEDKVKAETEAAKSPVDHTTLQLHNLLYEKNHYLKAIKTCKDFKSKYSDIKLVPEEEFFRDAPDDLKSDPSLREDPHKLMLQRLNFEMHQRKELCKQRELLEARKKMLQENITNRRKFLSSLPSQLKALKKASLPVQQHLGMLHTKRMKQHHLAELLPPPLYILYSQLLTYKEAFGEPIDLEILGSAKDAQTVILQQANKDAGIPEDLKADNEEIEEDDDSQRRRKRVKKVDEKENRDKLGIYHTHPLSVALHVYDEGTSEGEKLAKLVTIRFEYMPTLNVVSVVVDGRSDQNNILDNLFPDDTGLSLPNQSARLFAGGEIPSDGKHNPRWYKWAQHLSGLDFLPETPPLIKDQSSHYLNEPLQLASGLVVYRQQHRVQTVLQKLRARKKAQLALKEQLASLSKLERPSLRFTNVPWASSNPKNRLDSWIEIECSSQQSSILAEREGPVLGSGGTGSEAAGGSTVIFENEGGREDGELPSVPVFSRGIAEASISREPMDTIVPAEQVEDDTARDAPVASPNIFLPSLEKATSKVHKIPPVRPTFGKDSYSHVGNQSMFHDTESLTEEGIDSMDFEELTEEAVEDTELPRSKGNWKDHAIRKFRAVFRRDYVNGKVFELEAEIQLSIEYPGRCPLFQLRMLSNVEPMPLPAGPPGVLDVLETSVTALEPVRWFNQLRSIESKVNLSVLAKLPKSEENCVLAHQIALLTMLFDLEIDYELAFPSTPCKHSSLPSTGLSDVLDAKLGPRSLRGRDRRKLLGFSQEEKI